jgi:hypothetical protein
MKTKTTNKKPLRLCNYHSESLGWDDCSTGYRGCQVTRARSNREKQLKKALTNRLAKEGISKDWMKKNLIVIC